MKVCQEGGKQSGCDKTIERLYLEMIDFPASYCNDNINGLKMYKNGCSQ